MLDVLSAEFIAPIRMSLQVALVSSLVVLIIGMIAAKMMSGRTFRGKVVVETVIMLPIVLPPSVVGFALLIGLGRQSPVGQAFEWLFKQPLVFSWWAAVAAAVVVAFPLMYQSVKAGFTAIDREVIAAARSDGASERHIFMYVVLPLSFRFIISGWVLSFARALGEFGATLMVAGSIPGKTQTVATAIYVAVETNHMLLATLWVGATVVISFLLLFFIRLIGAGSLK